MQQKILKKWLLVLCILMMIWLIPAFIEIELQICWLYFNFTAFFTAFIFWFINLLGERQTPQKKIAYSLGAIGNKFLLTIISMLAYFMIYKVKIGIEVLIAFTVNASYFIVSYYYLFKLTKEK